MPATAHQKFGNHSHLGLQRDPVAHTQANGAAVGRLQLPRLQLAAEQAAHYQRDGSASVTGLGSNGDLGTGHARNR